MNFQFFKRSESDIFASELPFDQLPNNLQTRQSHMIHNQIHSFASIVQTFNKNLKKMNINGRGESVRSDGESRRSKRRKVVQNLIQ